MAKARVKKVSKSGDPEAARELKRAFTERGFVRLPNDEMREKKGLKYHRGYEVRIPVETRAEAGRVRALVKRVGLEPGKAYAKARHFVVPVYGAEAVTFFTGESPKG